MNLRATAVMIANQFEGRCTCAAMDGGVDCRWCQLYREVLRTQPLDPRPARTPRAPATSLSAG
jgi:hypothetical protein